MQIPKCFDSYNKISLFGDPDGEKFFYAINVSGVVGSNPPGFASLCVACGACMEKCPQHIRIPEVLERAATVLEDENLEQRLNTARQMFSARPH